LITTYVAVVVLLLTSDGLRVLELELLPFTL
jgi:hypothetical protein